MPYDYEEEISAQGPVIMPAPQVRAFNIKQWFSDLLSESGKFDWSYGFLKIIKINPGGKNDKIVVHL